MLNLNPVHFPKIDVDVGSNLQLNFEDLICTGLTDLNFKGFKYFFEVSIDLLLLEIVFVELISIKKN